jgi:DNA-binding NarL/FixJ family response regulator
MKVGAEFFPFYSETLLFQMLSATPITYVGERQFILSETSTNLTQRELDILKWVALGKNDVVIANLFGVSTQDVNHDIQNISKELNARNRTDVGLKAIKLGLV